MARQKKADKAEVVKETKPMHTSKTAYMLDVKKMEPVDVDALRRVIISGNLKHLSESQRDQYYVALADALGVDWRMRPFDYIEFDGKVQLYGKANLAEQLRANNKINIGIIERKQVGTVFMVIARAEMNGRFDESSGAVDVSKAFGTGLANLYMKAETKAKRRVTLSICGAGMLDETEIEDSAPGAGLSDEVAAHLFGAPKATEVQTPTDQAPISQPMTPAQAAAQDDKERERIEQEAKDAKAREAKILTTIEKWKKSDDGKEAMSLCLRLGYQSKSQMYEKYEACAVEGVLSFENFFSVLRDEWARKQGTAQ